MPNKTYADILGEEKANIDLSITDYVKQLVHYKDNPKDVIPLETEYRLYLQSKKLSKPKFQNIKETHKLVWIRVGDLRYSPKVNARWRTEKTSSRNKIYSLASEWNNNYLDAIHGQVINGKIYVGEGMKRVVSAYLNYGPDYLIPCLLDESNKDESFTNAVVRKQNNI